MLPEISEELKPCEKCGQRGGQCYANAGWFGVECENCDHRTGDIFRSAEEAATAWNRRALYPSPQALAVPDGWRLVPQAALDWLDGAAPDANGKWFGDDDPPPRRPYWWRGRFRAMLAASPPKPGDPA